MKSKKRISKRNLNLYNNSMDSLSSTAYVKIVSDIEMLFPHPISMLDLQEHHNTADLAKKINEQSVILNRLIDYLSHKSL